jgi:hypothetical protein
MDYIQQTNKCIQKTANWGLYVLKTLAYLSFYVLCFVFILYPCSSRPYILDMRIWPIY